MLSALALLVVIAVLGALGWLFVVYPDSDGPPVEGEVVIEVEDKVTLDELALALHHEQIIDDVGVWTLYMRLRGLEEHLRRGRVRFPRPMTPEEVARHATTRLGRILVRVTIPEGYNRFEIAKRLEEYGITDADDFIDATEDDALLASYGIEADNAEGYLFPDTYEFSDRTRPNRVVERMLANWTRRYEEALDETGVEVPDDWSTHDVVTLASIVEKEAAVAYERRRISGVFFNRLRSKKFLPRKRLQADPTVAYGCVAEPDEAPSCASYDGRITRAMLEDKRNGYNTYRHSGLPPGPISNPGKAALEAVLVPEQHHYFYFVARGGGRHEFSRTLRQHNNATNRYLR